MTFRDHPDVAFAIAGHHGGIPDPNGGTGTLAVRIKEAISEAEGLRKVASQDCPELAAFLSQTREGTTLPPAEFDLFTRMVFNRL